MFLSRLPGIDYELHSQLAGALGMIFPMKICFVLRADAIASFCCFGAGGAPSAPAR